LLRAQQLLYKTQDTKQLIQNNELELEFLGEFEMRLRCSMQKPASRAGFFDGREVPLRIR
jgi:hypothetical protein